MKSLQSLLKKTTNDLGYPDVFYEGLLKGAWPRIIGEPMSKLACVVIDQWTEQVAVAVESLPVYQQSPLPAQTLRNTIRVELEQALLGEECV